MTGREHILIGAGSTLVAVGGWQMQHGGLESAILWPAVAAAVAGSLGPDLDHPFSLASMTIPSTLIAYSAGLLAARGWAITHPSLMDFGLRALGPLWVLGAWCALWAGFTLLLVSLVLSAIFGHRGPVHSLAFGLLASALVVGGLAAVHASLWLAVPFAWGWLAHLVADATTPAGLDHVLWPLEASH